METIRVEREAGLVTITLDRPAKKNAINGQMWNELDGVFAEVALDQRGLALDGGNSWLLPRRIGLHKAKELTFFADMIDAKEPRFGGC